MTEIWTQRPTWADIERWMEYFRNHVPMTAQAVSNARELLVEWLRLMGALPPE